MATDEIRTHSTESFRHAFMLADQQLDAMLKADFGTFFITRVEELLCRIRLPVPPTRSTTHTFLFLTAGEAIMSIGSATYTIGSNECLIVPAGQVFSFSNLDQNEGYIFNFHTDFIIQRLPQNDRLNPFEFLTIRGNPHIRFDRPVATYILNLLERLFAGYTTTGLAQPDILQVYLVALLYEINQVYRPLSGDSPNQAVLLTNQFRHLLFTHIKTKHLVADYASMLHITPNHLNKIVKRTTGKSPTKCIDETLILEAKVLLYQTQWTIGQVAGELGIQDASYFSRLFKKYEGVSPLDFRKLIVSI